MSAQWIMDKLPDRFIDTVDELGKARTRIAELEGRNRELTCALVRAEAALDNAAARAEAEAATMRQVAFDTNQVSDPRMGRKQ